MPTEVVGQNLQLLAQARALLLELTDDDYRGATGRGEESAGVGAHLRHCLDFYRSFLRDLPDGRIDYDRRARDAAIENERRAALEVIAKIERGLSRVAEEPRPLQVRVDVSPAEEADDAWSPSTLTRELRFLVSHTVHHYALIAQLLRFRGRPAPPEFGIAPSTLAFWADEAPASR